MLYLALFLPVITVGVWMIVDFAGLWPDWAEPSKVDGRSEPGMHERFGHRRAQPASLREKTSHSV